MGKAPTANLLHMLTKGAQHFEDKVGQLCVELIG